MIDAGAIEDLLHEIDRDFLAEKNLKYIVMQLGADTHVIVKDFDFPAAYMKRKDNLMFILQAGYPNANLDMFWTEPVVKLANGNWPVNANQHALYGGVSWQRWSRHFQTAWRQGVDNLRTFVATIRKELSRGV